MNLKSTILGLNLLFLLVENRLSDFHCELEVLTESELKNPAISFCTQLDQHLMVGSYDQVMNAASNPPVPYYNFFLKSLLETVRLNIGECTGTSYDSLSVVAATKILMFTSEKVIYILHYI
jgi:26S proteasome regulatory subunit N12